MGVVYRETVPRATIPGGYLGILAPHRELQPAPEDLAEEGPLPFGVPDLEVDWGAGAQREPDRAPG